MKYITMILVFVGLFWSVPVVADLEFDFSGNWKWENDNNMFNIKLWQDVDILRGSYCAVALNGNRIDCDPEDKAKVNIWGIVSGNTAEVQFFSYYGIGMGAPGSDIGKAKLQLNGDQLQWTMIEFPANGHFFCPKEAVLEREKEQVK